MSQFLDPQTNSEVNGLMDECTLPCRAPFYWQCNSRLRNSNLRKKMGWSVGWFWVGYRFWVHWHPSVVKWLEEIDSQNMEDDPFLCSEWKQSLIWWNSCYYMSVWISSMLFYLLIRTFFEILHTKLHDQLTCLNSNCCGFLVFLYNNQHLVLVSHFKFTATIQ